jgi:hypothetical protein
VLVGACGGPRPERAIDTTAITFDEPKDVLGTRQECQLALDSARRALIRNNIDGCTTNLADAAAFFRAEATKAAPDARSALIEAATGIETLLANIAHARTRTPRDFDRVFAKAHTAEVRLHLSHFRVALFEHDHRRAGEELLMATDHLERATRDARLRDDRAVNAAIANAHSLALEMVRGTSIVPDEATRVTGEISVAIDRIAAHVYVPAGPEPLPGFK